MSYFDITSQIAVGVGEVFKSQFWLTGQGKIDISKWSKNTNLIQQQKNGKQSKDALYHVCLFMIHKYLTIRAFLTPRVWFFLSRFQRAVPCILCVSIFRQIALPSHRKSRLLGRPLLWIYKTVISINITLKKLLFDLPHQYCSINWALFSRIPFLTMIFLIFLSPFLGT